MTPTPHNPAAFAKRLADRMAAEGLSVRQAATAIGVGRWVVWRALQGDGISGVHMLALVAWLDTDPASKHIWPARRKRGPLWAWSDVPEKSV